MKQKSASCSEALSFCRFYNLLDFVCVDDANGFFKNHFDHGIVLGAVGQHNRFVSTFRHLAFGDDGSFRL